ncbi:MAG: PAS domain S-box protein [Pseudomonadota bacterium]
MTIEGTEERRERSQGAIGQIEARGGEFVKAVEATRMPMAVTDPTIPGNPIVFVNPSFLEMCGYEKSEVLGQNYHFMSGPHTDAEVRHRIDRALTAEQEVTEEVLFYRKDGREIWVSQFVSPVIEAGRVVKHFASFFDITDRVNALRRVGELNATLERQVRRRTRRLERANQRLSEEIERRRRLEIVLRDALAEGEDLMRQKDFLVDEVNHRAKNALAVAASLLLVQAHHSREDATRDALTTAHNRLTRIADVYAMLNQGTTPERVDMADYLHRLASGLVESLQAEPGQVKLEAEIEELSWPPELAVPIGLITNETLTNAFKHAFPGGRHGTVRLHLEADEERAILCIADDGVGLSGEKREGALGQELVAVLVRQIKGNAKTERSEHGGVTVTVTFPSPGIE